MSVGDVKLPFRSIWLCSVEFQEDSTRPAVREAGHFYLFEYLNTNFFTCVKALHFEEVKTFSPGREAHLHFSKDMGYAES